ncbi:MAG: hypothetical protein ACYC5M_14775 [Anaerolineae bacterium]
MSAFVVEPVTLGRIVSYLNKCHYPSGTEMYAYLRLRLAQLGLDLDEPDGEERLARALFDMNVRAVCQRYPDDAPERYTFHWQPEPLVTRALAYQSLRCFTYQCAEGDVPESDLYQIMDQFKASVAASLAREHPTMRDLPWA